MPKAVAPSVSWGSAMLGQCASQCFGLIWRSFWRSMLAYVGSCWGHVGSRRLQVCPKMSPKWPQDKTVTKSFKLYKNKQSPPKKSAQTIIKRIKQLQKKIIKRYNMLQKASMSTLCCSAAHDCGFETLIRQACFMLFFFRFDRKVTLMYSLAMCNSLTYASAQVSPVTDPFKFFLFQSQLGHLHWRVPFFTVCFQPSASGVFVVRPHVHGLPCPHLKKSSGCLRRQRHITRDPQSTLSHTWGSWLNRSYTGLKTLQSTMLSSAKSKTSRPPVKYLLVHTPFANFLWQPHWLMLRSRPSTTGKSQPFGTLGGTEDNA